MCYTLSFDTINSDCTLIPKHIVKTKIYFVCDELLGPDPTSTAAGTNASPSTTQSLEVTSDDETDVSEDFSSVGVSELDKEVGDGESFIMVQENCTEPSQQVNRRFTTANGEVAAVDKEEFVDVNSILNSDALFGMPDKEQERCEDEDCISLGEFGSCRVKGSCVYCDSGSEGVPGVPIVTVMNSRDEYIGNLILSLAT